MKLKVIQSIKPKSGSHGLIRLNWDDTLGDLILRGIRGKGYGASTYAVRVWASRFVGSLTNCVSTHEHSERGDGKCHPPAVGSPDNSSSDFKARFVSLTCSLSRSTAASDGEISSPSK